MDSKTREFRRVLRLQNILPNFSPGKNLKCKKVELTCGWCGVDFIQDTPAKKEIPEEILGYGMCSKCEKHFG